MNLPILKTMFFSFALAFGFSASADIYLSLGESTNVNGTKVTCGEAKPPVHTQSATSRICAEESLKGDCINFNENTMTGAFCIEGQVCGREAMSGKCVYFNTQAECGEGVCTKKRVCARKPLSGECVYYNDVIQCQKSP